MRGFLFLFLMLIGKAALAQPASLVADSVRIDADRVLIAEGNVEVFYQDARLTASRVTYDGETEQVTIEGPIRIVEGDGEAIVLGDAAELEGKMRNGIMTGARVVLSQQMQLAANELANIDGRYRRLTNAVASSCRVCNEAQSPLWEIRAARVLHDTEERQIYFTNAHFRVAGIPVFYIPRLRMPDPTVERARGFLVPQYKSISDIGSGILVPYFIPLGESADITIAPWIATGSQTVELRYRQAFRSGTIEIEGAISRDDEMDNDLRSYVYGTGFFRLPRDFRLRFDVRAASDDTYADQYDYNSAARLESRIGTFRIRDDEIFEAWLYNYDIVRPGSLREGDRTLTNFADGFYQRVFDAPVGRLILDIDGNAFDRNSAEDVLGRDVERLGARIGWNHGLVMAGGLMLEAEAEVRADAYAIHRDESYDSNVTRLTPAAAVALRWPLVRNTARASETLEPVLQLAWADVSGDDVPDEDSRVMDFDEGNLFALDRFPGKDRSETGARLNIGLNYSRTSENWEFNGYVGRILRFDDEYQFTESSGLNGDWSDWLVSGQVGISDTLTLTNRAVFDEDIDFARNELRLAVEAGAAQFASSYLWLEKDLEENRVRDVHEAVFTLEYDFNRHWAGAVESRWDIDFDRVSRTDVGLTYRNECLTVDLSVSQRYESAASDDATYDFGLAISLNGFGSNNANKYARSCSG